MAAIKLQDHTAKVVELTFDTVDKTVRRSRTVAARKIWPSILLLGLGLLLLVNSTLSYRITRSLLWTYDPWLAGPRRLLPVTDIPISLTDAELRAFDGSDPSKSIYVALNGTIYDVTAGQRFYGPEGSYHVLAGKDAARAFITTCFEDDNPDLRGAEWVYVPRDVPSFDESATAAQKTYREQELCKARQQVQIVLDGWRKVFSGKTGKEYFEVGQVLRPADWHSSTPTKDLCAQAQRKRPASKGFR